MLLNTIVFKYLHIICSYIGNIIYLINNNKALISIVYVLLLIKEAPRQFGDRTRGFVEVQCSTIKQIKCNEKIISMLFHFQSDIFTLL